MRPSGAGHGPAGNVYLSEANRHGTFASRSVLHMSAITLMKVTDEEMMEKTGERGEKERGCALTSSLGGRVPGLGQITW